MGRRWVRLGQAGSGWVRGTAFPLGIPGMPVVAVMMSSSTRWDVSSAN